MDHEGKATEAVSPGAVSPGVGTSPETPSRSGAREHEREHEARTAPGTPAPPSGVASSTTHGPSGRALAFEASEPSDEPKRKVKARPRPPAANHLRKFREELCLSQAELARRANLSALTVARIEQGYGCRMSTKRKILEALGLSLADRKRVFGEEE
jgi:DNA-binding XRE family transcriptional regulator